MTQGQVRAAMRRLKDHSEELEDETSEINLVPYMDIVTNIIIFLLAAVVTQVPLGNVNVSSPAIAGPGESPTTQEKKEELNLTVTVGGSGFTVAASGGVLPVIPKLPDGKYDFKALTAKLVEIKTSPGNRHETKVHFNADAHIPYALVVETLDAMREDDKGKMLFPDVNFAAGMQ